MSGTPNLIELHCDCNKIILGSRQSHSYSKEIDWWIAKSSSSNVTSPRDAMRVAGQSIALQRDDQKSSRINDSVIKSFWVLRKPPNIFSSPTVVSHRTNRERLLLKMKVFQMESKSELSFRPHKSLIPKIFNFVELSLFYELNLLTV